MALLLALSMIYPGQGNGPPEDPFRQTSSSPTWSRTYAPGKASSVKETLDGGYIVAGYRVGAWIMKANVVGEKEWEREIAPVGGTNVEVRSMQQTNDGGYVLAGSVLFRATYYDAWILKTDRRGNPQWSKTYGGSGDDFFFSVQQTFDGGYVASGYTGSFGPNVEFSGRTAWVFRLDSMGNVLWQMDYGADEANSVQQTSDGGFVVAGTAAVGTLPAADAWVFKLDSRGNIVWQKAFEVTLNNRAYSVLEAHDRGYILAAEVETKVFPSGNIESSSALIIRLDTEGEILWEKQFSGGGGFTRPFSVHETSDGGFIMVGRFRPGSSGEGLQGPFLLRLDAKGNMVWQRTYGALNDFLFDGQETRLGGFVAAGALATYCCGFYTWVLKLDFEGTIRGCDVGIASDAALTDTNSLNVITTVVATRTDAILSRAEPMITTGQVLIHIECPPDRRNFRYNK